MNREDLATYCRPSVYRSWNDTIDDLIRDARAEVDPARYKPRSFSLPPISAATWATMDEDTFRDLIKMDMVQSKDAYKAIRKRCIELGLPIP